MLTLPALSFTNGVPALPDQVKADFSSMFHEAFDDFGGPTLRRIKVTKTGFSLIDGGNVENIPADQLVGVFVGSAPCNHAVWYEKEYAQGNEPEAPDLTWLLKTPDTFPDALPPQFRKKIQRGGSERWAFQIHRRVAFVLVRPASDGQAGLDLEHPYVMDLSSMSLFGKGLPEQNMYKWSGIRDVCNQHSVAGIQVLPTMFLTKIILDPNVSVNGVVLFQPNRGADGRLQFLDPSLIMAVHETAQKQSTRDMLTIREKLTYGSNTGVQTNTQTVTMPTPTQTGQVVADDMLLQNFGTVGQQTPPVQTAQSVQPVGRFDATTAQPPQPTTITMPQQVVPPATGASDVQSLLAQAGAVLSQAAAPPRTATAPVNSSPQPSAPIAVPQEVHDATVAASIEALMSQLG